MRVENNEKATEFEKEIQGKIGVLTAQLLARHKGSESIDDWLEHATKAEADMGSEDSMSGVFSSILMCDINTIEHIIVNAKRFVMGVLTQMLEQARGTELGKFGKEKGFEHLSHDLKLMRIRELLVAIIKSANSGEEMRSLAVRLMLRLGYVFASA